MKNPKIIFVAVIILVLFSCSNCILKKPAKAHNVSVTITGDFATDSHVYYLNPKTGTFEKLD